jgi:lauroyl/myristoyl acyltransferase
VLRRARKWLVSRIDRVAVPCAPLLSERALNRVEPLIAWCGPRMPVLGRLAAQNMISAGLYSRAIHCEYFANVGAHLAGALQALRCAGNPPHAPQGDLRTFAEARVELDDSVQRLAAAAAGGRGAILVGPHIANYLVNLTRLNQVLPLTVYLRHAKDPNRQQAKQRWYRASGVSWICEPPGRGGPLGRLGQMSAALRAGRVLFITPDLVKKRGEGVPVRLLGREVYLPGGAAALAARTGAPLFALHARKNGRRQRLFVRGPFEQRRPVASRNSSAQVAAFDQSPEPREPEARPCALALGQPDSTPPSSAVNPGPSSAISGRHAPALIGAATQWFADEFERFLREQPALWYLWADKRWTRVFRGDPRYVASVGPR